MDFSAGRPSRRAAAKRRGSARTLSLPLQLERTTQLTGWHQPVSLPRPADGLTLTRGSLADDLPTAQSPSPALQRIPLIIATLGASYYIYSETVRRTTTHRRRQAAQAKRARREARLLEVGGEAADEAEESELAIASEQFRSTTIGGRYANCTSEWREQGQSIVLLSLLHGPTGNDEQLASATNNKLTAVLSLPLAGAWEWLFWKLIWQPCTGRIWWTGGLPSDPAELDATLPPCETPNWHLLFGHPPAPASSSRERIPSSSSNEGSSAGLDMSWDHVSVVEAGEKVEGFGGEREDVAAIVEEGKRKDEVTEDLTFTWIGQSTCFVQLEGVSILTDPVFADRTIPSSLAPPRLRPPPAPLSAFSTIDIVLVSSSYPVTSRQI